MLKEFISLLKTKDNNFYSSMKLQGAEAKLGIS